MYTVKDNTIQVLLRSMKEEVSPVIKKVAPFIILKKKEPRPDKEMYPPLLMPEQPKRYLKPPAHEYF